MSASENPILAFLAGTDPGKPAGVGQHVLRPRSILNALEVGLRPTSTARVLLVGQTGVGKTTEIRALVESEFAKEFAIVAPPVDEEVALEAADWGDLLVYTAAFAAEGLESHPAIRSAHHQLREALRPRQERTVQVPVGTAALVAAAVYPYRQETTTVGGPPEASIRQLFRNNTAEVHRTVNGAPAQFWDLAMGLLAAVRDHHQKDLVVVLDGLEKLPMERAGYLFGQLGTTLTRWPCRLLLTGPLTMTAEAWFAEVEERLTTVEVLRATSSRLGEPGVEFFMALAQLRGAFQVMDEADVLEQVLWSGGLPRQFLQLLTRAAQDAAAAGLTRVPAEFHQRARHRLAQRFQYQLEPQDLKALAVADESRTKDQKNRLLRVGALIEYDQADGSFILGVNPLAGLLLKRPSSGESSAA